uniref:Secreted protein n=1 Tax=Cacopsylla melanoneura TaxID=428564 RepID=A0A8D9BAR9_9HEMI
MVQKNVRFIYLVFISIAFQLPTSKHTSMMYPISSYLPNIKAHVYPIYPLFPPLVYVPPLKTRGPFEIRYSNVSLVTIKNMLSFSTPYLLPFRIQAVSNVFACIREFFRK